MEFKGGFLEGIWGQSLSLAFKDTEIGKEIEEFAKLLALSNLWNSIERQSIEREKSSLERARESLESDPNSSRVLKLFCKIDSKLVEERDALLRSIETRIEFLDDLLELGPEVGLRLEDKIIQLVDLFREVLPSLHPEVQRRLDAEISRCSVGAGRFLVSKSAAKEFKLLSIYTAFLKSTFAKDFPEVSVLTDSQILRRYEKGVSRGTLAI